MSEDETNPVYATICLHKDAFDKLQGAIEEGDSWELCHEVHSFAMSILLNFFEIFGLDKERFLLETPLVREEIEKAKGEHRRSEEAKEMGSEDR